ncbi:MAG TPA: acetate kinase [Oceanospirillales bacterium]|mgnify:FL=1|nr:acetate kinase [Oleispira sp.]HCM06621.1 acetate kinase [Oceanospirillales bacterium]
MSSNILVLNCGSSSIKFAIFDMSKQEVLISGLAERLYESQPNINWKGQFNGEATINDQGHQAALDKLAYLLNEWNVLDSLSGIGHRVVHGGEKFSASTLLNEDNIKALNTISHLAPLHNPVNMLGIEACHQLLPDLPQVAVFDTAFHQTMPEHAYLYAVPQAWYEDHGVRKYGFHGTSYRYIAQACAEQLNKPEEELNIICAHLGNGCSASAILNGKSVDTSMGLTPLDGLIMGTRCGSIDPGLIEFMMKAENASIEDIMTTLNKKSGLLGLSGCSNDMRTLLVEEESGNEKASQAINAFCYRIARELSALSASLPDIDAVVFTGGIGEHAASIRQRIINFWPNAKITLDQDLNEQSGNEQGLISLPDSPKVMVIATNEELMIAQDCYELCNND